MGRIEKLFPAKKVKRSAKEKVLSSFHSIIFTDLDSIWERLYHRLGSKLTFDMMMRQYTSQKLFDKIYVSYFSTKDTQPCENIILSMEEENIVRYIAGYVPLKLLRKYEKQSSTKASMYVECLSNMKVDGQEADFVTYAKKWTEEVNRGGLFEVSETTYALFRYRIPIALCFNNHIFSIIIDC